MGTLFGFAVGYVVGARAGANGFDELTDSIRELRESDEFRSFVNVLTEHARSTARQVSERFLGVSDGAGRGGNGTEAMLAAARARVGMD